VCFLERAGERERDLDCRDPSHHAYSASVRANLRLCVAVYVHYSGFVTSTSPRSLSATSMMLSFTCFCFSTFTPLFATLHILLLINRSFCRGRAIASPTTFKTAVPQRLNSSFNSLINFLSLRSELELSLLHIPSSDASFPKNYRHLNSLYSCLHLVCFSTSLP